MEDDMTNTYKFKIIFPDKSKNTYLTPREFLLLTVEWDDKNEEVIISFNNRIERVKMRFIGYAYLNGVLSKLYTDYIMKKYGENYIVLDIREYRYYI